MCDILFILLAHTYVPIAVLVDYNVVYIAPSFKGKISMVCVISNMIAKLGITLPLPRHVCHLIYCLLLLAN